MIIITVIREKGRERVRERGPHTNWAYKLVYRYV